MKSKNIFYFLLMLVASVGFTACGDDDDYLYKRSDGGETSYTGGGGYTGGGSGNTGSNVDIEDLIDRYVSATFTEGEWYLDLKFTTTLGAHLPGHSIIYQLDTEKWSKKYSQWYVDSEWQFGSWDDTYMFDNLYLSEVDEEIYFDTYKALLEKYNRGETFSDDEKELFRELKPLIKEDISNMRFELYVIVDDYPYHVYAKTVTGYPYTLEEVINRR